MDDLDQQLAHLQLMNARDLSPKPASVAGNPSSSGALSSSGLVRKVGPAVPPKPAKKPTNSTTNTNTSMHQQQQPSAQSIAQANASNHNVYSNIQLTLDNPAILEQKLEALEHHKRVLESQRRAAAATISQQQQQQQQQHLQHLQHQHQPAKLTEPEPPPVSQMRQSAGYDTKIYENQQQLYENMKLSGQQTAATGGDGGDEHDDYANYRRGGGGASIHQLYGNTMAANNTYSNTYGHQQTDELLPPPPPPPAQLDHLHHLPASVVVSPLPHALNLSLLNGGGGDYSLSQTEAEDDLPPPPSPVSSSYSELRRATDPMPSSGYPMVGGGSGSQNGTLGNYQHLNNGAHLHHHAHAHQMQQLQLQQQQQQQQQHNHHHHQQQHGSNGGSTGNGNGSNGGGAGGGATYANNYVVGDPYADYGGSLPGSSTYESIYEPINPRPPSQMSSRSNYSLYNPYVSGPQGAGGVGAVSGAPNGSGSGTLQKGRGAGGGGGQLKEEAEVDILTDLLVQSMDSAAGSGGSGGRAGAEADSYGVCVQCGERVVGESSGCTAMEQIYHITCFTCCQCQINLQGKPFYALDGKPCCEEDYLNTLEKCSVCMKPILERILRATGKPYHPGCFCCVVCGKSLDGVPFTVDATNQNHCIEDFHKKFAPRCCVCRQPILPEPGKEETVRVVALDRSFHVSCYKCEDCGLLLSSEAEGRGCFPLDDHILCKSCNAKRVQALTSHMSTEL